MKKQFLAVIVGMVALFSGLHANAQTEPAKSKGTANGFSFGIGLEGALPIGDMQDVYLYQAGAGATLRFSQGIAKNFDLLLTGGAIGFIPEDLKNKTVNTKASIFIPVKLGARVMLGETFYLMGEAGLTFTKVYGVTNINTTNGAITQGFINGSTFAYAPSIGVRFGGFDIGARFEGMSDINGGKFPVKAAGQFMGLRIGYDF